MRRLVKILAIILLLLLVMPYFFGVLADHKLAHLLNHINSRLMKSNGMELKIIEVKRGWFSSQMLLQVKQKTNTGNTAVKTIPVTFRHGPFSFIDGHFMLGVGTATLAEINPSDALPCRVSVKVHVGFFDGWTAFLLLTQKNNAHIVLLPKKIHILNAFDIHFSSLLFRIDSNAQSTHLILHLLGSDLQILNFKKKTMLWIKNFHTTINAHVSNNQDVQALLNFNAHDLHFYVHKNNTSGFLTATANKLQLTDLHYNTKKIITALNALRTMMYANKNTGHYDWRSAGNLIGGLISDMVTKNTVVRAKKLAVTTPDGKLILNYKIAFPSLKDKHSFADIIASTLFDFSVNVPNWQYNNVENHFMLEIHDLNARSKQAASAQDEKITLGTLGMYRINEPLTQTSLLTIKNLFVSSQSNRDTKDLSSTTQFNTDQICLVGKCVQNIKNNIQVLHLFTPALYSIQHLEQQIATAYDTGVSDNQQNDANDLVNNYLQLITAHTQILFSNEMVISSGPIKLTWSLSWPHWTSSTPHTIESFKKETVYQVHATFPVLFLNAFLASVQRLPSTNQPIKTNDGTFPSVGTDIIQAIHNAIQNGYIKQVNGSYQVNVTGDGKHVAFNSP